MKRFTEEADRGFMNGFSGPNSFEKRAPVNSYQNVS